MKYFLRSLNNSLFKKYLLTTNIVSSGFLFSVGDGISQYIEHKMQKSPKNEAPMLFNWDRSMKMFVIGAAGGPIHHYFYGSAQQYFLRFNHFMLYKLSNI